MAKANEQLEDILDDLSVIKLQAFIILQDLTKKFIILPTASLANSESKSLQMIALKPMKKRIREQFMKLINRPVVMKQ